jgi:hypothetical protein
MKHLKKYNESGIDGDNFDSDLTLIKEIILELKHEYPSIEGEIVQEKFDDTTYTIIKIKPLPVYNDYTTKLDNLDKRMKYFNDVIECSKRLQDALEREVRLQGLFNNDTDGGTINIWIDDIKHKGKKWKGQ